VAAIAATSVALCCLPYLDAAGQAEVCPLHRAADETCSMTQCPMHGDGAAVDAHDHDAVVAHRHDIADVDDVDDATVSHTEHATPQTQDCRLVCDDEDLSPAVLLGLPGLLPMYDALAAPDAVTALRTPPELAPPDRVVPVYVPPPRF
jgi:hypothetical protein